MWVFSPGRTGICSATFCGGRKTEEPGEEHKGGYISPTNGREKGGALRNAGSTFSCRLNSEQLYINLI